MEWYYAQSGVQKGPVSEAALMEMLRRGEIKSSDLVWKDGMENWRAIGEISGFQEEGSLPAPREDGESPYQAPRQSGGQVRVGYSGRKVPNYLWQSILATVFCCVPLGVVAIVYAAQVDGMVARGDIVGAEEASRKAKMWATWSAISIVIMIGLYLLVGMVASMSQ